MKHIYVVTYAIVNFILLDINSCVYCVCLVLPFANIAERDTRYAKRKKQDYERLENCYLPGFNLSLFCDFFFSTLTHIVFNLIDLKADFSLKSTMKRYKKERTQAIGKLHILSMNSRTKGKKKWNPTKP